MTTAPAHDPGPSDAELITAVREGATDAYATLYSRHRAAAYHLARQLTRSPAEADDLVSEAFAKLLDTLRGGGGPDTAFRAYLLTALRHCAYDRARRDHRIELTADQSAYDPGVPFTDTAVAGLDRSLAARAFATLPQRWQTVLWHTEIEGQSAAEVAPLLGLTPNGLSALAYRAREGLRQAYLQVHLADTVAAGGVDRCQAAIDRLGAWTRSGLSRRETAQVEQHLDSCDRCRALATELADVNGGLRTYVAPLVLGAATAAYLSTRGEAALVGLAGAAGTSATVTAALMVGVLGGPHTPQATGTVPAPVVQTPVSRPSAPPRPPVTSQTRGPAVPAEAPGTAAPPSTGAGTPVEPEGQPTEPEPIGVSTAEASDSADADADADAVSVTAAAHGRSPRHVQLRLQATSLGDTTGLVAVLLALPENAVASVQHGDCVVVAGGARCTAVLGPGEAARWQLQVSATDDTHGTATVTAVLGTAEHEVSLPLQLPGQGHDGPPDEQQQPPEP